MWCCCSSRVHTERRAQRRAETYRRVSYFQECDSLFRLQFFFRGMFFSLLRALSSRASVREEASTGWCHQTLYLLASQNRLSDVHRGKAKQLYVDYAYSEWWIFTCLRCVMVADLGTVCRRPLHACNIEGTRNRSPSGTGSAASAESAESMFRRRRPPLVRVQHRMFQMK